jgi:hypothetical protein
MDRRTIMTHEYAASPTELAESAKKIVQELKQEDYTLSESIAVLYRAQDILLTELK